MRYHDNRLSSTSPAASCSGTFNFFSTDLMLRALMELPAYVVYTGFSMGVVLLTYAVNALIMHEELTRRDHAAIVLVLLALALINLPG